MNRMLLFIGLLASTCFSGSFARISDPDGYVNIRSTPNLKGNVIDKVQQNECVETFGSIEGWTKVAYTAGSEVISGFIRGSRLVESRDCNLQPVERKLGTCAYAQILLEDAETFSNLQEWHSRYSQCNSLDIQGIVSEKAVTLLSKNWSTQLSELEGKSQQQAFIAWILKQIESAHMTKELKAIVSNEASCKDIKLCIDLIARAKKALDGN